MNEACRKQLAEVLALIEDASRDPSRQVSRHLRQAQALLFAALDEVDRARRAAEDAPTDR
jgi:hypothetical protein